MPTEREVILADPSGYMTWGDLDKPFHRPECACPRCENFRIAKGRPTHEELRALVAQRENEKLTETTT